jgi:PKD repeat protein
LFLGSFVRRHLCAFAAVALFVAAPVHASPLTFVQPGFTSEVVAGPTGLPGAVAFAPDGRLFVLYKGGIVFVWDGGARLNEPFIDISSQVCDCWDRGLLGIAVDPEFPQKPYIYLLFTYDPPGVNPPDNALGGRVSRLIRVEADPAQGYNVALPGSTVPNNSPGGPGHWVMLGQNSTLANIGNQADGEDITTASCMVGKSMANPPIQDCLASDEVTHTIGSVVFGTDRSLFVSNGDGSNASGVDPRALRSQNLDSLSGKILHIDPDTGLGLPDNPFYNAAQPGSNRSKVWARGLRNPFRISIDPATNDPYIGDVGWNTWEEINNGKGANFGWPCYEGGVQTPPESGLTTSLQQPSYASAASTSTACAALYAQGLGAVKPPVFAWIHGDLDGYGGSGGAAAEAGARYTGTTYPALFQNALFISDYSRLWIRFLTFDAQGVPTVHNFAKSTIDGPVQVLQGPDTNLYILTYGGLGEVRRVRYTAGGNTPPTAVPTASPSSGSAPLVVSFTGHGSYDPDAQPLSLHWDFGDGATSTLENPSHTYASTGTFSATLTVTEQTAPFASGAENVVITVGSVPPVAVIAQPLDGATFAVGNVINYAGSASAGGVPLPPSALTWQRRMHHNEHIHFDDMPSGASGSFPIVDHADGVWFELCLTATAQGLTDTQCVELLPRQTPLTVASVPAGMHIVYEEEGVALTTPAIVHPTEGCTRTLDAPAIEQWRSFDRWSDGLTALSRQFLIGTTPLTFTAQYVNQPPLASAGATAGSGPGRFSVAFNSTGSSDPEGGALTYAWNFGDGQSGSGPAPSHLYATPGHHLVTLTVTDPIGGTDTDTVAVNIPNGAPTASFTRSPATGAAGLLVTFVATGSTDPDGDALAYAWDFGDGATGTGAQVTHLYVAKGSYVTTLGVSDPYLATGTAQVTTVVTAPGTPPGCGIGPELAVAMSALLWLRQRRTERARSLR